VAALGLLVGIKASVEVADQDCRLAAIMAV
jgi:hypothetical protein